MPDEPEEGESRALLGQLNLTELVQVARGAGIRTALRSAGREALLEASLADLDFPDNDLEEARKRMEAYISRYKSKFLSQLPGCDGTCTTYGCPDLIVGRCWHGMRRVII